MDNKNQPAFPNLQRKVGENVFEPISEGGLSKREYFAAMAMQGIMGRTGDWDKQGYNLSFVAVQAVLVADLLIAELDKPVNQ